VGSEEVRQIRAFGSFAVTAAFAVLAYVWLFVIVSARTPDVIDVSEGVVTCLLFPLFLFVAFIVDCRTRGKTLADEQQAPLEKATMQEIASMELCVFQEHGQMLKDMEIVEHLEREFGDKLTRAHYRIDAVRSLVRGRRIPLLYEADRQSSGGKKKGTKVVKLPASEGQDVAGEEGAKAFVEFLSAKWSCTDCDEALELMVCLRGEPTEAPIQVQFRTRDGTATSPKDFIFAQGTLEFAEVGEQKSIIIPIGEGDVEEGQETFYVELYKPKSVGGDTSVRVALGDAKSATCQVIDEDLPGVLGFATDKVHVTESPKDQTATLWVTRSKGCKGAVSCCYVTEDGSATAPEDFEQCSGTIEFMHGQLEARIDIPIKPRRRVDEKAQFRVQLQPLEEGGAELAAAWSYGREDPTVCAIALEPDAVANDRLDRVTQVLRKRLARLEFSFPGYKEQFAAAMLLWGGDDEADEPPSLVDYSLHALMLLWKVAFAFFIPPAHWWEGWISFFASLLGMGIVTAMIGDLAGMIGCYLDIPDAVMAVTFVALGTSFPEALSAPLSAKQDPHADIALGGIAGSLAVNVFLGLGIPWLIGSVYWDKTGLTKEWEDWVRVQKPGLLDVYPQGSKLVFVGGGFGPVCLFLAWIITLAIALLAIRRHVKSVGAELGGPRRALRSSSIFLVLLWVVFVSVAVGVVLSERGLCQLH